MNRLDDLRATVGRPALLAAFVAQLAAWFVALVAAPIVGGSTTSGTACAAPYMVLPVALAVAGLVVGARFGDGGWALTGVAAAVAGWLAATLSSVAAPGSDPGGSLLVGPTQGVFTWLVFFSPTYFYGRYGTIRGPIVGVLVGVPVVAFEVVMWFLIVGLAVGFVSEC